jgi:hypothetical protein
MVFFFGPKKKLQAIPVRWTTLASPDVFVRHSQGRAAFRPDDLLELFALIQTLHPGFPQPPLKRVK